jgi:diguanylate cyclase (GGDEF)-like protein/PAS domain S-box-containing protein
MNLEKKPSYSIQLLTLHYFIGSVGLLIFLNSIYSLQLSNLDGSFILIAIVTIVFGSSIGLTIESLKSTFSVVDILIFLILLLFGSEAAICVISIETYFSSFRYTKTFHTRLFNAGTMAISIFASVQISKLLLTSPFDIKDGISFNLGLSLSTFVLSHYFLNSFMVALSHAFRINRNVFSVWKEYYIWLFLPFLASGCVALVAANTIQTSGIFAFILILPIIGIIYFSYYSQNGKLQAITEKAEQAEQHLGEITESEERFRSAFSNAPIGMALISTDGKWLQTNQKLAEIFNLDSNGFADKQISDFLHPEELVGFKSNLGLLLQDKTSSYHSEMRFFNNQNEEIWTETSISHTGDKDFSQLICQIQDITARRKAEAKLKHDAFYDPLTGLANRNLMMKRLTQSISNAENDKDYKFAVLFVNLDRFKLVNDSSGHNIGDKLLIAVSQRLQKCLPENAALSRLGGDEFFVLIESYYYELSKIEDLAIEIQNQINSDFRILAHEINVTASIGIVYNDEVHITAEDLLRDAGAALHLAKIQGRAKYVVFDEKMRAKATSQMQLEKDLQKAVERDELFLVYQPILALESNTLDGFEALVRWNHPKLGLVSPMEFIPLAEENGMIVQIGQFVIEESCRQLIEWQDHFSKQLPITISVNVSAKQLLQKHFFVNVVNTLEKYKIKPQQIKIEITESVVVENSDVVLSILRQFRTLGINLSMDDFGTGYSSLSYLHQLPISTLKIDRSFISKMADKTDTNEIVRTIILLAKNLNLNVVAEGIENQTQFEQLKDLQCDFGQGYLFAKPLNVADASEFINELNTKDYAVHLHNLTNQSSLTIH